MFEHHYYVETNSFAELSQVVLLWKSHYSKLVASYKGFLKGKLMLRGESGCAFAYVCVLVLVVGQGGVNQSLSPIV